MLCGYLFFSQSHGNVKTLIQLEINLEANLNTKINPYQPTTSSLSEDSVSAKRRKALVLPIVFALIGSIGTGTGLALIAAIPHLYFDEMRPMDVGHLLKTHASVGCVVGLLVGVIWSVTILIRYLISARLSRV